MCCGLGVVLGWVFAGLFLLMYLGDFVGFGVWCFVVFSALGLAGLLTLWGCII